MDHCTAVAVAAERSPPGTIASGLNHSPAVPGGGGGMRYDPDIALLNDRPIEKQSYLSRANDNNINVANNVNVAKANTRPSCKGSRCSNYNRPNRSRVRSRVRSLSASPASVVNSLTIYTQGSPLSDPPTGGGESRRGGLEDSLTSHTSSTATCQAADNIRWVLNGSVSNTGYPGHPGHPGGRRCNVTGARPLRQLEQLLLLRQRSLPAGGLRDNCCCCCCLKYRRRRDHPMPCIHEDVGGVTCDDLDVGGVTSDDLDVGGVTCDDLDIRTNELGPMNGNVR